MAKGIVVGAVGIVLAAAAAAWIGISLGYAPANADAKPSRLERFIAVRALRAVIRREAPKGPNPAAYTNANVIDGIKLYAENCAVCHGGATGERSNIAQGLYQKPPQFGMQGVEHDPDGFTYWKIAHGIRMTGMPAFESTLSQEQIWKIALFLKRMDSLSPEAEKAWDRVGG